MEDFTQSTLVLLGELNDLHGNLGSSLEVLLDSGASSEELEVEGLEVLDNLGQGRVGDITAEQDTFHQPQGNGSSW
ncbi:hypothetical protein CEH01_09320 [Streptococcus pyogenes]|nr:hypothetical protein CEH01_09320 [Streptococcus pyogenes]